MKIFILLERCRQENDHVACFAFISLEKAKEFVQRQYDEWVEFWFSDEETREEYRTPVEWRYNGFDGSYYAAVDKKSPRFMTPRVVNTVENEIRCIELTEG